MNRDPPWRLARSALLDPRLSNLESRRPRSLDPLLDEGGPVATGFVGEGLRNIGKRGAAETVLTVEQ